MQSLTFGFMIALKKVTSVAFFILKNGKSQRHFFIFKLWITKLAIISRITS